MEERTGLKLRQTENIYDHL